MPKSSALAHTVATSDTPLQCSAAALTPRRSRRAGPASTPSSRSDVAIEPSSPKQGRRANRGAPCAAEACAATSPQPAPKRNSRRGRGRTQARQRRRAACSSPKYSASHAPGASLPRSRAARPPPGRGTLDAPSALIYRSSLCRSSISDTPPARRGARDHERERRSGSDVRQRTMLEAQALAKTIHELLVLATLRDGDKHGYQIALDVEERSEGAFVFQHGTLYPILHRLEAEKLIRGRWSGGSGRRRRKVYTLTAAGRRRLEEGREWCRDTFERLLDFLE